MAQGNGQSRNLILAAMIFAVSMSFIDQTIVSIAVPSIQHELGLSSTGVQWVVNAYILSLAALFALGGRLSDIFGHRRMCIIGVIVFAAASTMCGLTPKGSYAEAWIVGFPGRVISAPCRHDPPGRPGHRGANISSPRAGARPWPSSSASRAA